MENVAKKLKLFKRERGTFIIATSSIYCNCHYKLRNNWKPVISFAVIFGLLYFCFWLDLVSRDPKLRTSRIIVHAGFLRLTSSYPFFFLTCSKTGVSCCCLIHPQIPFEEVTLIRQPWKLFSLTFWTFPQGLSAIMETTSPRELDWALLSSVLGPWSGPLATPLYTPLQTTVFQCFSKHLFDAKPLLLTCD